MAWTVKQIETYRLWFDPRNDPPGRVLVDVRPIGGGAYFLWFTRREPLPANQIGAVTGNAHFPYDMLPAVLDTLREEAPVFLQIEPDTERLQIATWQEPLGEGRDADAGV